MHAQQLATVDRDSVSAGDDCDPHQATFHTSADATILAFLDAAQRACPLARITGGRATWLVDTEGCGQGCIGVVAQQWAAPQLLLPAGTTVAQVFGDGPVRVHFRYWCQADPQRVFAALSAGEDLPPRHG